MSDSSQTSPTIDDPSVQSVARVYAVSLLDAAAKTGQVEAVLEEFGSFLKDVLHTQPEFRTLLCGPMLSEEARLGLIDRVIVPRSSELLANTLKVLARHDRLSLVDAVHRVAVQEHERRSGQVRVQVTTATPLSTEALEALRQRLAQTMSASPIVETAVDPQLLGGLLIRVGDTVYDGTVRNRLRQLRGKLRERCLNEVQRGRDRFSHSTGN